MGRVAEVRARAQRRTDNLYDTLFTRRVSAYLTAAAIPLGIAPNTVSAVNLGVGATVCGLVGWGHGPLVVAGAALVHLYAVLDSVDGELARWSRRGSLTGMFLENWSAYLMIGAFPIAVALHLQRVGAGDLPLWLALIHASVARQAMPVARRVVLGVMQASPDFARSEVAALSPAADAAPAGGRGPVGRMRTIVEKTLLYPTNVWVTMSSLLIAEAAWGAAVTAILRGYLVVYLAASIAKEIGIVAVMLRSDHLRREMALAYGDAPPPAPPPTRPDAPIV